MFWKTEIQLEVHQMVNLEFLSLSHNSKSLSLVGEGWGGYIYIYICAIFYLAISGIEKKSFLLTCKQFEICSLDHAVAHPPSETLYSGGPVGCHVAHRSPPPQTGCPPPAQDRQPTKQPTPPQLRCQPSALTVLPRHGKLLHPVQS